MTIEQGAAAERDLGTVAVVVEVTEVVATAPEVTAAAVEVARPHVAAAVG